MLENGNGVEQLDAFRLLGELPWAVVFVSGDGLSVKFANRAFRHFLPSRYQEMNLEGVRLSELMAGGENGPMPSILRRVSEQGERASYQGFKFTHQDDGEEFCVELAVLPLDNGTERADLLVAMREITERIAPTLERSGRSPLMPPT